MLIGGTLSLLIFLSYSLSFYNVFISTVQEKLFLNLTSLLAPLCSCLFGFLGDFFCCSYFFYWWGFDSLLCSARTMGSWGILEMKISLGWLNGFVLISVHCSIFVPYLCFFFYCRFLFRSSRRDWMLNCYGLVSWPFFLMFFLPKNWSGKTLQSHELYSHVSMIL